MSKIIHRETKKYLIILRGVPAVGKTQVSKVLREKIAGNSFPLNLDDYAFDWELKKFDRMIEDALKYDFVIGELFSGKSHTLNPMSWISKFKSEDYKIHSFILDVSLKKGYSNSLDSRRTWKPPSIKWYQDKYEQFYQRLSQNVFVSKAGLDKEIRLKAEDSNWERIAHEILDEIKIVIR